MTTTEGKSVLEIGHISLNHDGEELCGDHVEVRLKDGSLVFCLADGLGSGVTANILSTMTATMLVRMIEGGVSLADSVESLLKTLPASKKRGNVAYSTFTIVKASPSFEFEIYNYDNPEPILLHEGKEEPLQFEELNVFGRKIKRAVGEMHHYDHLILYSDGVLYAGVGENLNFGWGRPDIVDYAESLYYQDITATNMASSLLEHCDVLYNHKPGDDATVCSLRRRPRAPCNYMVGAATVREDDEKMMREFFSAKGSHIVSGGTTCHVASRYLKQPIETSLEFPDPKIPPICHIKGVDLATEGVITLNKVCELAEDYVGRDSSYFDWCYREDGASLLAKALFQDATEVHFYVGCAVNPAYRDPNLGIPISLKMKLVEKLADSLEKMGKEVTFKYY